MNRDELKTIKTWFGNVSKWNIERIKEKLEERMTEIEEQIMGCRFVIETWQIATVTETERLLWDICMMFEDCTRCIAFDFCRFAKDGCTEVHYCEGCPRLRICLRNRSVKLKEYLEGNEQR
jgi:hypothetical protein